MEKNVIEVNNVTFGYKKGEEAIKNVSFNVSEGSVTMLIGPNGSGKTTLLKMISGLLQPLLGEVLVFGEKPKEKRNDIGYVPQKLHFDQTFPITVFEFLSFTDRNISKKDILEILNGLNISGLEKDLLGNLSGGQLQRVLIGRALLGNPKILLLDEPVSGVDIGGERNFYDLIKNIQEDRGVTIVMVSHEVHLVSTVATQVICINKEMLCSGTPDKALLPEVVEKLYGKDVSMYKHHC